MNESNAVRKVETDADDWLSVLIDGELPPGDMQGEAGRLVAGRLLKDDAAWRRWAEYALIGDALRGQHRESERFLAGFRAALADEPTLLVPMPAKRNMAPPVLLFAAAATVAGIAWTVLSAAPESGPAIPIAAAPMQGVPQMAAEVFPYLAAHQDYAHAVLTAPEMNITQVSLSQVRR